MRGTTATISERRRQVAKLTEGGASLREVGAALGTSHVTVSRDLRALGMDTNNGHKPASLNGHSAASLSPVTSWDALETEAVTALREQARSRSGAAAALAKFAATKKAAELDSICEDRHVDIDHYNAIVTTFWHLTTNHLSGAFVRRVALELETDHVILTRIISETIEDVAAQINAAIQAHADKLDGVQAA